MVQLVWACTEHDFLKTPSTQAFVSMEKLAQVLEYIKVCTPQVFAGTALPVIIRKYAGDPGVYASMWVTGVCTQV